MQTGNARMARKDVEKRDKTTTATTTIASRFVFDPSLQDPNSQDSPLYPMETPAPGVPHQRREELQHAPAGTATGTSKDPYTSNGSHDVPVHVSGRGQPQGKDPNMIGAGAKNFVGWGDNNYSGNTWGR
ncbi:hypothetical protein OC844_003408 [Tilletia horrida]|nr:hypothetical protein OC844_003408 [Tilletia horrida]